MLVYATISVVIDVVIDMAVLSVVRANGITGVVVVDLIAESALGRSLILFKLTPVEICVWKAVYVKMMTTAFWVTISFIVIVVSDCLRR